MLCFRCGSHNPDGSEFCSKCGQEFTSQKRTGAPAKAKPKPKSKEADGAHLAAKTVLAERYEIRSVLGSGPTGIVYRAHDLEMEVDIALKLFHPQLLQSREDKKHFLSIIRTARRINHPFVIKLYDEDEDEGRVFVTMQLLEGLSLRKIIRLRQEKNQVFNIKEIEPILSHVCQALEKGHESTIHGNCKPENIIVLPDLLKVTDFGLLQALPRQPFIAAQQAAAGGAYLAPELRSGSGELTPAADIYSLATIVLEMITGRTPQGKTVMVGELPGEFAAWGSALRQALDAKPERRQGSLREFFEQLHYAGKKVSSRPSAPPRPAPSRPPRARASRGGESDDAYPPTVIDAQMVPNGGDEEEPVEPASDDERLASIAAAAGSDEQEIVDEHIISEEEEDFDEELAQELQDVDDFLEEPDGDEGAEVDEFEEGETLVATATPVPAQRLDPNSESRVARPVEPVQPMPVRKRTAVQAPPGAEMPAATPQPQAAAVPSPAAPAVSYGPFSQPPFPPSFVTQPPAPRANRAPVYVFLTLLLLIVAVGVYFLVDYLKAQAELARAQAQAALQQSVSVAVAKPSTKAVAAETPPVSSTPPAPAKPAPESTKRALATGPSAAPAPASELAAKAKGEQQQRPASVAPPVKTQQSDQAATHRPAASAKKPLLERKSRPRSTRRAHNQPPAAKKPAPPPPAATAPAPQTSRAKLPAVEEVPLVASTKPPPAQPPSAAAPPQTTPPAPASAPAPAPEKSTASISATPPPAAEQKKCPPGMIYIHAGSASIGSSVNDPMRNFGELKLHKVQIGDFCIDRYEYPNVKGRVPLTGVSWKSAARLCRKRGKRLCTEEEWEFACKGAGNRRFPYGNQWNADACNTEDASGNDRSVAAAGSFPRCRSPFGLMDMSGNVSEWTASSFSPGVPARVYKGGSAARPNWAGRCASRSSAAAGMRKADLGFRCCADPK